MGRRFAGEREVRRVPRRAEPSPTDGGGVLCYNDGNHTQGVTMAAPELPRRVTPEEYLAYERQAEYKSEYIAGQIVARSGASRVHTRICVSLLRLLDSQTLNGPCETFNSDQRVKVTAQGMYTYPDVTVVCGEPQ